MPVVAAERPVKRLVAPFDVAVAVLLMVRADDPAPAVVVDARQHKVVVGQPLQDVVAARVADVDAPILGGVRLGRRNVQRLANLFERIFALRMKLDQPRLEQPAPLLEVDAARNAAVAHRPVRARIGVARVSNRLDGCGKVSLGRLFAECVAPLERPLARLHDPCRVNRRHGRLGADVVQHHEQDVFAVLAPRARLAVLEPVNDERAGVDIPRLAVLHLGEALVRQIGGEGRLRHAVLMIDQVTRRIALRLLPQQQGCLAIGISQLGDKLNKLGAILTHRLLLTCHNVSLWRLPRSAATRRPMLAVSSLP